MKEPGKSNNSDANCLVSKSTSLGTLIAWNISKALEKNPTLDVKDAIKSAQCRLEQVSDAQDINTMISESAYERHLACAMLAWQQLGHNDAESLCRFVENKRREEESKAKLIEETAQTSVPISQTSSQIHSYFEYIEPMDTSSYNSYAMVKMGPVVKLPVETKVVMHMGSAPSGHKPIKKGKAPDSDVMKKIDQACCVDTKCISRLTELDVGTKELRSRAALLARREAERVELLERAENAWKDLELGYQRRLTLAEEKEDDLALQTTKVIEERNKYKDVCTSLAKELKKKSEAAETDRDRLSQVEKEVCQRACKRLQLSEQCAKGNSAAADLACRAAQLDRDLQLKEAQARRKALNMDSEAESARALTLEAERAMRAELGAIRDQIAGVSKKLLDEDAQNEKIRIYLENLRQEKMGMIEDLERCKVMSDGRNQAKVDELKKAREKLAGFKEKLMECRCKVPVDAAVEVKRTPSLAALCKCTPEQKISKSCSCTSMRSKLLSDLLADLFGGLQSELGVSVAQMPCQLLKCLEDNHNWDRATIVKNNLKDYFSQLLVGELDIAIATSIEKYHAKWVSQSCADVAKIKSGPGEVEDDGWQERAIEHRAQKLAAQLAEELFQERADQLTERAKEIVAKGPPPCQCKPPTGPKQAAVYPCLVKNRKTSNTARGPTPVYWHQAMHDVTQLRSQVDHLKKPKAGNPQQHTEEGDRKALKKSCNRIDTLGEDGKINNATTNQATGLAGVVKAKTTTNVEAGLSKPIDCHQAMQGITQLRLQIEELKKDSLKKEDLKMLEKKFSKIIQRASIFTATNCERVDCYNGGNDVIKKEQKINKAANQYAQHNFDFNKLCTKRNIIDTSANIKKGNKPNTTNNHIINHKVEKPKPYKSIRHTYAVNMCLCSTKQQQPQKIPNEKVSMWRQKVSKQTVSQMSGGYKQSSPIDTSLLSEDLSDLIDSKEFDEPSCASNCVCFHKKPSNTSIDKLLETLAKWKCDLDKSIVHNKNTPVSTNCNSVKPDVRINPDNKQSTKFKNLSSKSKSSIQTKEISREAPIVKVHDCLNEQNGKNVVQSEQSTESKTSKRSEKHSGKSGHIGTTESEYVTAINLDKSNEHLCKCVNNGKNRTIPFKCLTSSKCDCDIFHETRKQEDNTMNSNDIICLEVSDSRAKHQQPVKDFTILNVSKSKEKSEKSKSVASEKTTNNILCDEKTTVVDSSDYQIKFLGVTLTDTILSSINKTTTKNEEDLYDKKNTRTNLTPPCKQCQSNKTENIKDPDKNRNVAKTRSNDVEKLNVTEYSKLPNKMKNDFKNVFANKYNYEKYTNNVTKLCQSDKRAKNNGESHNQNLEYMKENLCTDDKKSVFNNQTMFSENGFYRSPTRIRNKSKHNKLDLTEEHSEQKTFKTEYENCQLKNRRDDINGNVNHNECNPIKETHDEGNQEQKPICDCSVKFDEFKNFIKCNFIQQKTNEDVALDIQSLVNFKIKDENCVCCNKLNIDDTINLEENAFHLLEEYLRKKMEEFKGSSCSSSCIPLGEEEKLFEIILQRVKQLIAESTSQITCKCCSKGGKSQGSWDRAYGLLQEYLKKKIKKVQCACALAEDNNDTILSNVLDKVNKLIEYDFQRLKDVFDCKNDPKFKKNITRCSKAVNFETEIPEKDTNAILIGPSGNISLCCQIHSDNKQKATSENQTNRFKQSISSQVPLNMGIKNKCYDIDNENNHILERFESISHPFDKYRNCNCAEKNTVDIFCTAKFSNPAINKGNESKTKQIQNLDIECIKTNESNQMLERLRTVHGKTEITVTNRTLKKSLSENCFQNVSYVTNIRPVENITVSNNKTNKLQIKEKILSNINNESVSHLSDLSETHDNKKSKNDQQVVNGFDYYQQNNRQLNMLSIKNQISQDSVKTSLHKSDNNKKIYTHVPYIGYTINCSCDVALKTCNCSKLISKSNTDVINNIIKKCMPDETYLKKVSYIMKTRPMENTYVKVDMPELSEDVNLRSTLKINTIKGNSVHECETEISRTDTQFVLKKSKDNIVKNNATTNTLADDASLDTDYSANEDTMDWCECSSEQNHNKYIENERLKNSMYFTTPLGDFDDGLKDVNQNSLNLLSKLSKHMCSCEMVPICQVKLLIENIESKLEKASCTCDSMVPKVCPVHSS